MTRNITQYLTRKRIRKQRPRRSQPRPTTYMGLQLTAHTWQKIIGYAAYDAGLPMESIQNPQCQRAYIAAAILTGGSENE